MRAISNELVLNPQEKYVRVVELPFFELKYNEAVMHASVDKEDRLKHRCAYFRSTTPQQRAWGFGWVRQYFPIWKEDPRRGNADCVQRRIDARTATVCDVLPDLLLTSAMDVIWFLAYAVFRLLVCMLPPSIAAIRFCVRAMAIPLSLHRDLLQVPPTSPNRLANRLKPASLALL